MREFKVLFNAITAVANLLYGCRKLQLPAFHLFNATMPFVYYGFQFLSALRAYLAWSHSPVGPTVSRDPALSRWRPDVASIDPYVTYWPNGQAATALSMHCRPT